MKIRVNVQAGYEAQSFLIDTDDMIDQTRQLIEQVLPAVAAMNRAAAA